MNALEKNRPAWRWILIMGLGLGLAVVGCRNRGHGFWGHDDSAPPVERMGQHVEELLDEIKATPDQRRSIRAALNPLLERARDLEGSRGTLRGAYRDAWGSSAFDAAELNALLDAELDRWVPLLHDLTRTIGEVHASLSLEQREEVAEHIGRHQRR